MGTADVEAVWRIESARIVAALTRFTGDFGLAEDAAQEAVAEALVSWPLASPANPAGWLMATARRRAIDAIRRRTALQDRYALLATDPAVDEEIDPDRIDDDVLALMFVSRGRLWVKVAGLASPHPWHPLSSAGHRGEGAADGLR
jgi:predicted RNA polymerase sigma factor